MKTINPLFVLLFISLFFISSLSFAQQTHYVTLHVNTNVITSQNELEVCSFTSESAEGDISEGDIENFTISVSAGDSIIWNGVSSYDSDNDIVNITSINYHGGDNVFDTNVLQGNGETPETVVGIVQPGTNGLTEKYTIKFKVMNNGTSRGGTFQIDPKIRVKP
jgi:hypothetical protein